jgi:TonB family protein
MKYFWIAIVISIIFHLMQFLGVYWAGTSYLNTRHKSEEIIEIELADNTPQNDQDKPIVKAPDLQKKPPESISKPAQFFSEKTQRSERQMQAQKKGSFQQQLPQVLKKPPEKKYEFQDAIQSTDSFSSSQMKAPNQWTFKSGQQSQFEYNLPSEIPYGEITVLDTDSHMYASFYNRVVDLFYIRWVQRLDGIWSRLSMETKRELSGRTWLTEVEIILNSDGIYKSGVLRVRSGFPPFDQAVLYAFQSAQVFPNPPRGKVEADGTVRLKYRVAVQVY